MTVVHLKTRVPESRQILLTLPPDCPVGEADLEIVIRPHEPTDPSELTIHLTDAPATVQHPRPSHPKVAAEYDVFLRMLPEWLLQYRGRYVAVHEGAIVAVGDTEVETLNLAYARQPGALVLVRKVTDQPEPIERLPSFRPVGGV
jgi:hypothetical protein